MTEKKIGSILFDSIPELNSILKLKKDVFVATLSKEWCKEHKINPENLKFDILKDSRNKIWFAQVGTEQTSESNKPASLKEVLSNV